MKCSDEHSGDAAVASDACPPLLWREQSEKRLMEGGKGLGSSTASPTEEQRNHGGRESLLAGVDFDRGPSKKRRRGERTKKKGWFRTLFLIYYVVLESTGDRRSSTVVDRHGSQRHHGLMAAWTKMMVLRRVL